MLRQRAGLSIARGTDKSSAWVLREAELSRIGAFAQEKLGMLAASAGPDAVSLRFSCPMRPALAEDSEGTSRSIEAVDEHGQGGAWAGRGRCAASARVDLPARRMQGAFRGVAYCLAASPRLSVCFAI